MNPETVKRGLRAARELLEIRLGSPEAHGHYPCASFRR